MRSRRHGLAWALFLLGAGLFLLLKNQGLFKENGEAIWGGLYILVGGGLLVWFLIDRARQWRAIAGFPLLSIGSIILLAWRGINLGDWTAALVLFGVALGFWTVLLVHNDNGWALIPAGVLTLMGVLIGLQARLSEAAWLGIFFLGLAAVFGLLYLLRLGQRDTAWAGIPAGAFLLIGLVKLAEALKLTGLFAQWWPAALLVAGGSLLILAVRPPASEPAAPAPPTISPIEPAPALSPVPSPPTPPPAGEPSADIYTLLKQQPQDTSLKE